MLQAVAYVNWGRWVADCPRADCANAEQLVRGAPRFACSFCGYTCSVSWPDEAKRIVEALAARPVPSTRNWLPGETVAMLEAENVEHGVPV